jgi:hypothetical protein
MAPQGKQGVFVDGEEILAKCLIPQVAYRTSDSPWTYGVRLPGLAARKNGSDWAIVHASRFVHHFRDSSRPPVPSPSRDHAGLLSGLSIAEIACAVWGIIAKRVATGATTSPALHFVDLRVFAWRVLRLYTEAERGDPDTDSQRRGKSHSSSQAITAKAVLLSAAHRAGLGQSSGWL